MKEIVLTALRESLSVKEQCIRKNLDQILKAGEALASCMASGHKVLIFGNGGSAADAQHIAAELVNRFRIERPPLAAIALTTDTSVITSIGNDYHFDEIFEKQVKALGRKGDMAWGISTSGNSRNVLRAIRAAREQGLSTIGMTGRGGELATAVDTVLAVEADVTARIQETHIFIGHVLCELVDRMLFADRFSA